MERLRKNKKGFTLVEIIVVLVILAILAVIAIPTMIGYVDEARGKAIIAEARAVYVAAQSAVTEKTALNQPVKGTIGDTDGTDATNTVSGVAIKDMAGVNGTFTITQTNGRVTQVVYTNGSTVTLDIGENGSGNVTITKP